MKTERSASCRCGALTAVCSGEPARISVCHCLNCKQRSGSAFTYNATYDEAQVRIGGEPKPYTRTNEEGRWSTDLICPTCGGTIAYRIEVRPGMVTIPVGNFRDPDFPEPTVSVYESRSHSWVRLETQQPLDEY